MNKRDTLSISVSKAVSGGGFDDSGPPLLAFARKVRSYAGGCPITMGFRQHDIQNCVVHGGGDIVGQADKIFDCLGGSGRYNALVGLDAEIGKGHVGAEKGGVHTGG